MEEDLSKDELRLLAHKWKTGTLTDAEAQRLARWDRTQRDDLLRLPDESGGPEVVRGRMLTNLLAAIEREKAGRVGSVRRLWPRIAAAASILLALTVGGYFITHRIANQKQALAHLKPGTFKNDALPGNKAVLTLADGQQLAVTAIPAGRINHTNVRKEATGALVYGGSDAAPDVYNTLTVPRGGGKHELRLADGTLAVLDAGSSIRFPVAFNGKERRVSITGQVYFEVVHSPKQPFYVMVDGQTIEDIGTHFNVNAFDGEIRTTLIEGSVKVGSVILNPGQQALRGISGNFSVSSNVDEEEVLAWKNDLFKFGSNTSLQTVMNQLSRWYDLDVTYEGANKQVHFAGYVPRNSKLSEVCKILEYSGVKFSLEGKKMIVYQ